MARQHADPGLAPRRPRRRARRRGVSRRVPRASRGKRPADHERRDRERSMPNAERASLEQRYANELASARSSCSRRIGPTTSACSPGAFGLRWSSSRATASCRCSRGRARCSTASSRWSRRSSCSASATRAWSSASSAGARAPADRRASTTSTRRRSRYRVFRDLWAVRTVLMHRDALPPLERADVYGFAAEKD